MQYILGTGGYSRNSIMSRQHLSSRNEADILIITRRSHKKGHNCFHLFNSRVSDDYWLNPETLERNLGTHGYLIYRNGNKLSLRKYLFTLRLLGVDGALNLLRGIADGED